jgi:hypothetical protein
VHIPKYTARVSIILASLVVVLSIVYREKANLNPDRAVQNQSTHLDPGETSFKDPSKETTKFEMLCRNFYQMVCDDSKVVTDPTGSVHPDIKGEVEALRLYEMILHEHPNWSNEEVDAELVNRIYTPKRRKMLEDIYQWVQTRMIRFIEKQPKANFPSELKMDLVERIKSIKLEIPPPASLYANEPDLFTKNDVYYEGISKERRVIRVGGAYLLSAKSWFNRVFTLAHELSHVIDPCELTKQLYQMQGYQRLLSCFKETRLITKEQFEDNCRSNQFVGELFADWLATQIAIQALELYSTKFKDNEQIANSVINSVKDLCHQESWLIDEANSHPPSKDRIEKIFGQHPSLQLLLGCSGDNIKHHYCSFEGKR